MRISFSMVGCLATVAFFAVGCAGPEQKLGRGIRDATEFGRLGEIRREMEQTAIWKSPDQAYTTGFIRGFDKSMVRTAVGVYEIVTFPIASYGPILKPGNKLYPDMTVEPTYPDSYHPRILSDSTFQTDTALGFDGGDVAPMIPGSRFHIFDN